VFATLTEAHEDQCAYGRVKVPVSKRKNAAISIFYDSTEYDEDLARFRKQLPRVIKKGRIPNLFEQGGYASIQHVVDYVRIPRMG